MSDAAPFRVAVVGAGPAGFFATAELLKQQAFSAGVDLFDRLPTPFGLVRNGVAPDHQNIKAITARYAKDAEAGGGRLRLFGNVEIGKDVTVGELRERYHAIIFAFGAQSNRRLGIPGEELSGVHPASVFVAWYNGHPDCVEARFGFSVQRAVVVGMGNVALDVARILAKPTAELAKTDISDVALNALRQNRIEEVIILGRSSQAQATYTSPELEELTRIPGCDLVVAAEDRRLDADSEARLAAGTLDARVKKNLQIVADKALLEPRPGQRLIRLRNFVSPVELFGDDGQVRSVLLRHNRLLPNPSGGEPFIEPAEQTEELACGLLFRSIGYKVAPLPGVPFDEASSTVPHERGQILEADGGAPVRGYFVTGWAKRGPQGVIGTNKPDATETVATLMAARARGELLVPALAGEDAEITTLLARRGVQPVTYSDWKLLDQLEVSSGKADKRPRRKFTDVPAMLTALANLKLAAVPHDDVQSEPRA